MAWLTREDGRSYSRTPKEPDMETLSYWLARLEPVIRAETEGEIIVVLANRTGTEEEAVYAGTSAVLGIQAGEVKVYGILGRGEKELLVVDTKRRPQAKLISQPNSAATNESEAPTADSTVSHASKASEASGLSVNTALTSPDVGKFPQSMAEVMAPLSPADPSSPNAYFAAKRKNAGPETPLDNLKSSIPEDAATMTHLESDMSQMSLKSSIPERTFSPPIPSSPTFRRPPSPKSRNASRTRPLHPYEEPLLPPALVSHDLAKEEQTTERVLGVKSPPHSAAAIPDRYQSSFTARTFGARSQYMIPRSKSSVW